MTIGSIGQSPWELAACRRCGTDAEGLTRGHPYCRRCVRDIRLLGHYGIGADEVDRMIAAVEGICPVCARQTVDWAVDHDHACCPGKKTCGKCVRGVLCQPCNRGLGMFDDSPDNLRRAIAYLEAHRQGE